MGTHPSGPSEIIADDGESSGNRSLQSFLDEHGAAAVGAASAARFGARALPFLFKVLSVRTALSIQSHPDKKLAERLHAEKPEVRREGGRVSFEEREGQRENVDDDENSLTKKTFKTLFKKRNQWYKDDNHKPEMAIALGDDFSALCGFADPREIAEALAKVPELRGVVGEAASAALEKAAAAAADGGGGFEAFKPALREAFTALMTAEPEPVGDAVDALVARVGGGAAGAEVSESLRSKLALAVVLAGQYPRDVGVLAAFFLNHLRLRDGEAVALAANEPHAYVSGQLVECMAASDNVVRAGLTPKPRDTAVLCASLSYATGAPAVLRGEPVQEFVSRYDPSFAEFEVARIEVPAGRDTLLPPSGGAAVLLVAGEDGGGAEVAATATPLGEGSPLRRVVSAKRGDVLFIPAGTPLALVAAAGGKPFVAWLASVNAAVVGPGAVAAPAAAPAEVPTPAAEAPALAAA